jgi:vacuolar-type H+-ATPase subunit H
MDLQQMLAAVEFNQARHGYEPSEVRSFLAEVSRGVAEIERRSLIGSDDEVRRTLVLAQRAADAAVAEAKEEAQRILSAAQERARKMLAETEAHSTETRARADREASELVARANASSIELVAGAEVEARRGGDELRANMREQVAQLGDQRAQLAEDITELEAQLDAQRRRMASAIETLQLLLDNPDMLGGMEQVDIADFDMVEEIEYTGRAPQMTAPVSTPVVAAATQMDFESMPDVEPVTHIDLTTSAEPSVPTSQPRAAAAPAAAAALATGQALSGQALSGQGLSGQGLSTQADAGESMIDLTDPPKLIDLRVPADQLASPPAMSPDQVSPEGSDSLRLGTRPMTNAERFASVIDQHRADPITAEIPVIAAPPIQIDGNVDDAELLRRFLDAEPDDAGRWRRRRR